MITFLCGYIFDIFGRRFSIYYMLIFGGLSLALIPTVAPSQLGFILTILMFNLFSGSLGNTPLIQDYAAKESYGRATALSMMGLSLGVLVSLSVLFEFTKNLDPQYSWGILSMLMVIFGLLMIFMIDEPPEGLS